VTAAAAIVLSYPTSVTLRQLFYRLVAVQIRRNTKSDYKGLSERTAEGRREGWFPDLIDRGRSIYQRAYWECPADALGALVAQHRRDRTEGQAEQVWIGVEKAGIVVQLESWFGELGVPIVALGGYASQSYADEISRAVSEDGRPAVLLYAGDHDASGEDIDRDFLARTVGWKEVHRVALSSAQVDEYALPPTEWRGESGDPSVSWGLESLLTLRKYCGSPPRLASR